LDVLQVFGPQNWVSVLRFGFQSLPETDQFQIVQLTRKNLIFAGPYNFIGRFGRLEIPESHLIRNFYAKSTKITIWLV